MRLADKVAVVTGAAQGFGEGIAERFVAEGARVVVADLNEAGAKNVAARLGKNALACRADVGNSADVAAMMQRAHSAFGRLDIVVNNAGTTHVNKPMLDVTEAEFDRIFAVNVKGIYLAALHAVPLFRLGGGGAVLNIASTAGLRPRPGLTVYNASKGAVNVMTKSMALEFAPDKIRVNALCPVAGDTPLLASFLGPNSREAFIKTVPLGRLSTPQDIAAGAVFLCSDEANFFTGVCLEVDGGRCV
ncbi:MAG: glucose 1-dehydrogenase [Rhodospirillaceae bacterium]|nr:glucose 1-dehydrogenase [Rhodospirillaceae bacterium]